MVDYLINSCGFSKDKAIFTASHVAHIKSPDNPDSVLKFLKGTGLNDTYIRDLISLRPRLLSSNVEKNIQPKVKALQELGLSGSDLGDIILRNSSIFVRSIDNQILPSIEFLRSILYTDEDVIKAIKRSEWLLTCGVHQRMMPNIEILRNCGVCDKKIKRCIIQNARFLLQTPSWLGNIVKQVEGEFGVSRNSGLFCYALEVVGSLSKSTIESKFQIFKSFGWSDSDVKLMFRKLPYCLGLSEANLQKGLNFLMKELGYDASYITHHPKLLCYSLEGRIIPRHAVVELLKSKELSKKIPSLYTFVSLSEDHFLKEFVFPYKDKAPDVYATYLSSKRVAKRSKKWAIPSNG